MMHGLAEMRIGTADGNRCNVKSAERWFVWPQVAVKPYLLYENSYAATPGHIPKDPTVSQVPTEIGGAVSLTIMNAGKTTIQVSAPPSECCRCHIKRHHASQDSPFHSCALYAQERLDYLLPTKNPNACLGCNMYS